jgi:hypothetical protein
MMKKSTSTFSMLSSLVVVAGMVAVATPARAQTSPPPMEPAPPPPPPVAHRSSSSSSLAGGGGLGLGVGATAFVSGLAGPEVVYDQAIWHLEGLFAFDSVRANGGGGNTTRFTTFDVGVSAWYHMHQGASSDFSLGGGVGFVSLSGGGGSASAVTLEPGAEVRAFITPNVSLQARVGLAMLFGDAAAGGDTHILLNAQFTGGFGFTYFFR